MEPTSPSDRARQGGSPLRWVALAALLGGLAWWLLGDDLVRAELGAGERLVARVGAAVFVVEDGDGRWRALSAEGDDAAGVPLPALLGAPVLDGQGRVVAPTMDGLARLTVTGASVTEEPVELPSGPGDWNLAGVDGADEPVLVSTAGPEAAPPRRIAVRRDDAWQILDEPVPEGQVLVSTWGRALAFRGEQGWEVWVYEEAEPVRRLAAGCVGPEAAFTPDGALVTDGRTDGLWRVELDEDVQGHMAVGNLGTSPRVPWSCGFRGDPVMLLAPQWDIQGNIQLQQTHLSGGGRWRFTTGFTQHYAPTVSADGRHLAYVQAAFDPEGTESFEEELFLFDFAHPQSAAVSLGTRAGGLRESGPAFVGTGSALVWIAEGRVHRVQRSTR